MRLLAVAIILSYGGLALFGLGMLSHGEHGTCPFSAWSGDCAIVGSLGSAIEHLEAFSRTLLALPVFFAILFFAVVFGEVVSGVPPAMFSPREGVFAENIFLPVRRNFRRWLSLVSTYS